MAKARGGAAATDTCAPPPVRTPAPTRLAINARMRRFAANQLDQIDLYHTANTREPGSIFTSSQDFFQDLADRFAPTNTGLIGQVIEFLQRIRVNYNAHLRATARHLFLDLDLHHTTYIVTSMSSMLSSAHASGAEDSGACAGAPSSLRIHSIPSLNVTGLPPGIAAE